MTFHYSPDSTLLRHPYMYYTDKVNWLRINKVNNKYWKLWLWVCVLFLSRISSRATSMKANVKCYVLTIILNGNNIAQGEINIFSHFNIRGYIPFSSFSRINRKWLLKSKKYYRIRVQQVNISRTKTTPHLPISDNFGFIGNFGRKTQKIVRAVLNKTGSYPPILLIFNSKHGVVLGYTVYQFEANRSKITTVRVPHTKTYKMAAMTSSNWDIPNLREKKHWPMSSTPFVWSFIKIGRAV